MHNTSHIQASIHTPEKNIYKHSGLKVKGEMEGTGNVTPARAYPRAF